MSHDKPSHFTDTPTKQTMIAAEEADLCNSHFLSSIWLPEDQFWFANVNHIIF